MRAIARRDDVQASFVPSGQGLVGEEARLTMPARDLPPGDVALTRGEADAIALRLRYHDARVHAVSRPREQTARDVFDAVEQSRCEALGMRRMSGVTSNLDARLEQQCRAKGYNRAQSREDVPLAEVLKVLTREAIAGHQAPASARSMVDLWRSEPDARGHAGPMRP